MFSMRVVKRITYRWPRPPVQPSTGAHTSVMFTVFMDILVCKAEELMIRSGPSGHSGSPNAMQQSVQAMVANGL